MIGKFITEIRGPVTLTPRTFVMRTRHVIAIAALVAAFQAVDLEAMADKDGGRGDGKGGSGGGGGAPLPALGVTLLGQAIGAGGLFAVWRRRRKK